VLHHIVQENFSKVPDPGSMTYLHHEVDYGHFNNTGRKFQ
jgi:hypothetical protein